jgi:hypothetical protein
MKIYKYGVGYYRMLQSVGSNKTKGYEHYALWQPVRRFLFWWIRTGKPDFWLDMYGFEEVKKGKKV